jgi:hypothetical protein
MLRGLKVENGVETLVNAWGGNKKKWIKSKSKDVDNLNCFNSQKNICHFMRRLSWAEECPNINKLIISFFI